MDVWKKYEGKKVFLRTNKNRVYSGVVKDISDVGNDVVFISLIDIKGDWVTISINEIVEIKEED